jgi:hypothetical protein
MADHIFRSPAIIYKKGLYTFAFIPDLDLLKNNRLSQMIMDFHLNPKNDGAPYIYYGFGNYKSDGHIFFKHDSNKKKKFKSNTDLIFGYYILIFKNKSNLEILKVINNFLWEKYGKPLLYKDLKPQILPYDFNVKEGFKAIIEKHKCWIDFEINGSHCGGFFQNSWLGKKKRKYKYTPPEKVEKHKSGNISRIAGEESLWGKIIMHFSNSPFWIKIFDKFTRNLPIINRTAEIWNNAWFLNIRSGYGFRYFGELWKNNDLLEKGRRILNTLLILKRIRGVFPSLIFPSPPNESAESLEISTINGLKAFIPTDDFHLVDTTITMYWGLKHYQDFEQNKKIIEKAKALFELLREIQLDNGAIPTYIGFDENNNPIIKDTLINSASSGAPLMFLTELYKILEDKEILKVAKDITSYLRDEIIPQDKWHDFEPFFSCTHLPLDFYDQNTKSHCMNTLCIYWNAAALLELYKITNNQEYLELGERVLAILSLFQQVWNMPYISFDTFGGFASQNEDAELSDARQALFVRIYMNYYLETGKTEYMERGIAALRASWAMQLLIDYEEICPGNLKGLTTIKDDGVDKGCVCENYGHSGYDLRVPGYIMFDWGVGSSIAATAYTKKHFGDIFIDFKEQNIFGIDGILLKNYEFKNKKIEIDFDKIPEKEYIIIKAREPPEESVEIILNKKSIGLKENKILKNGFQYKF